MNSAHAAIKAALLQTVQQTDTAEAYQHNIRQSATLLKKRLKLIFNKVGSGEIISERCVSRVQEMPKMRPDMVCGVVAAKVCHPCNLCICKLQLAIAGCLPSGLNVQDHVLYQVPAVEKSSVWRPPEHRCL